MALSCVGQASLLAEGQGADKDEALAVKLLSFACDKGQALGCAHLGLLVAEGRGVKKDAAGAIALFNKACDAGEVIGCLRLGVWYEEGRGVPAHPVRAYNDYIRGCKLRDLGCCKAALRLCVRTKKGPLGNERWCLFAVDRAFEASGSQ
jgi:TPR repeat protein